MGAVDLGLDTFGDRTAGPDGEPLSYDQVIRDVVAEGVLADKVGLEALKKASVRIVNADAALVAEVKKRSAPLEDDWSETHGTPYIVVGISALRCALGENVGPTRLTVKP